MRFARFFHSALLALFLAPLAHAADPMIVAPSGEGTVASPYRVDSLPNLAWVSANATSWGGVFVQGQDIDASATATWNSGAGFAPIGNGTTAFKGTYHGSGHVISGLTIVRPAQDYIGLFGSTDGSTIDKLRLRGANVQGKNNVGVLAGSAKGSFLDSCVASGSVQAYMNAGGLVGSLWGASTLKNSHASASIQATNGYGAGLVSYLSSSRIESSYATGNASGASHLGGLVAESNNGRIVRCYASGSLTGPVHPSYNLGGLLGVAVKADTVELSYASGAVNGTWVDIGGLVGGGSGTVLRSSFSLGAVSGYGAGLIDWNRSSALNVTGCYWNTTTSGARVTGNEVGTVGLADTQMMDSTQLRGLGSFESDWILRQGQTYPGLRALDNAPFAKVDTLAAGASLPLSRLLANDIDIETNQASLTARVDSILLGKTAVMQVLTRSTGSALDLTGIGKPGDTLKVHYRVGEVRSDDTLWGNAAWSVLVRDPAILVKTLDVYENGSIAALAARNGSGQGMSYTFLETPTKGTALFRNDSLIYTPNAGFVGSDALRFRVVLGTDTADQSVAIIVSGPAFAQNRVFLGRKAGSLALNRITPVPVAWKLSSNASWFSVTPTTGTGGAELTITALSDDTLSEVRQGQVTLTAGAYTQTFQVIQTPLAGSGSEADPYLIANYGHLKAIRSMDLSKVYRLSADIDASSSRTENDGDGFAPIGSSSSPFTGRFHGGNFAIKGLFLGGYSSNRALIGHARGARLDSIDLTDLYSMSDYGYQVGGLIGKGVRDTILDCSVEGQVGGYGYVGGLAGELDSSVLRRNVTKVRIIGSSYSYGGLVGSLSRSQVDSCEVSGKVEGQRSIGGLVGSGNNNRIRWSHSHALVNATGYYGGGLVGESDYDTLASSYATGAVSGGGSLGGLLGDAYGSVVQQCYAAARLSNPASGGLIGYGYYDSIVSSVALGASSQALSGGLVASSVYSPKIGSSYWDTALTKTSGAGTGTGLSRAGLMSPTALAGLGSFGTEWILRPDSTYPGLRSVDNAPFAFPDTLVTGQGFDAKRLLANDYDIVTWRTGLVVRIDSLSAGTTDSLTQVTFPTGAGDFDTLSLLYRVGRIRATDTLWGSQSQSFLVANPRILVRTLSVYQDSFALAPAAKAVDGSVLSYGLLQAPAHGTALFRHDSLLYTPSAGYAGTDSLRFFATNGLDTNSAWVKVTVTGPVLKSSRLELGQAAASTVTDSVSPAPVAWKLTSSASWLKISPDTGKGAAGVVYSALTANTTGKPRNAVVTLKAGATVQILTVVQNSLQGMGTEANPFLLTNYADLKQVENHGLSKTYRLTADIDASPSRLENGGSGFTPIGQDSSGFSGTFHGAGHLIKGLSIDHNNDGDYGLFRRTRNASVDSLGLVDVRILTSLTGYDFNGYAATFVGALAGWADSTRISQCYASGQISGGYYAGGLVGQASRHSQIKSSYSAVTISGEGRYGYGGGLVGYLMNSSLVNSFTVGALEHGVRNMGTLAGYYTNPDSVVNCVWDTAAVGFVWPGASGNNPFPGYTRGALSRLEMKDTAVLDSLFGSLAPLWSLRADSTVPGLRALDNAPFAVPDTFVTGQHFALSRLVANDFDVETYGSKLVARVVALDAGTTDSVKLLDFSKLATRIDTVPVRYQVGEVRAADTLWGSVVTSLLRLDPRIVADSITALTDSSAKVRAAVQTSGAALSYSLAVAPLHGSVSFEGDSLKFVPTTGFAGTDSLLLRAHNGIDTATSWVRVRIVAPFFVTPRTMLGNSVGMKVMGALDRDPKSWTLSHAATWYSVTRGKGSDATKLEFTVLAANTTGGLRTDTLVLSSGAYRQTLVVAQTTMKGTGTAADPYQIATLRDLKLLEATGLDKEYRLVADLNLANNATASKDTALQPIGSDITPFTGRFHGAGHMLRGLSYPDWEHGRGFFRATSHAVIDSLGIVDANFFGGNNGGALVATAKNTRIEKVFVTGLVSVYDGGALVGRGDSILMRHCYSTAPIDYADADAAGLVGSLSNSRIESSWSMSIGQSSRNQALVWNTYNDTLVGCYWSMHKGAQSNLDGNNGTVSDDRGLTLSQLKDSANLAGLGSFDSVWKIRQGVTYPTLRGMYSPPQGHAEKLQSGSTFYFSRLMENDVTADGDSGTLAFKLLNAGGTISWNGHGVTDTSCHTDSLTKAVYSPTGPWEDPTQWISYRPGEVIGNDTIWGDPVSSRVTINPFLFLRNLEVLTDSSVSDLLASEINGDPIEYAQPVSPLHGVATFRNDSLVYTPTKGFAGKDSLQVRGISGTDTSFKWVRITVKGAHFGRRFVTLGKATGSLDSVNVSEAPVAWSIQSKASWFSVAPASGTGAANVVFTATDANPSSQIRMDTVFLNFGVNQDTLVMYQNGMGGAGTEADPFLIATYADLKSIDFVGMDKSYRLVADIDASPSKLENNGRGFKPLGQDLKSSDYDGFYSQEFKGRLHGGNHAITGLFIDQSKDSVKGYDANSVGLFYQLRNAVIDSLKLLDVSITGAYMTGGLAAWSEDSTVVRAVAVTGSVKTVGKEYHGVGGLIGYVNSGRIYRSSMTGTVTESHYSYYGAGGLVGYYSGGMIDSCFAKVTVLADSGTNVGGLVGYSNDSVLNSKSEGLVRGGNDVGGLVGHAYYGLIESSHSSAEVVGNGYGAGGLAGQAYNVRNSYATGSVQGGVKAGGLVGRYDSYYSSDWQGFVQNYATGSVRGADLVGGLIGYANDLRIDTCYATGSVHSDTGLAGGLAGSARKIRSSYATGRVSGRESKVGGLVGDLGGYSTIAGNYWDAQASGRSHATATSTSAVGGMRGLNTAGLTDSAQLKGLGSFATVWQIRQGATYPGLRLLDNAPFAFADTIRAGLSVTASQLMAHGEDIETGKASLVSRIDSVSGGALTATGLRFPAGAKLGDSLQVRYRIGEVRAQDTLWGNRAWVTVRLKTVAFVGLDSLFTYGDVFALAAEIPGSGTVTFSVEGPALSVVGSKATAVKAGTATLVASSPGLDTVRQSVRVEPKTISVHASPRFKTVGEMDPALVWSATGLVASDTLTGALVRDPGDTVGSYAINQGSLAVGSDYFLKFVPGVLTIEPKPVGIEPQRPRLTKPGALVANIRTLFAAPATGAGRGELSWRSGAFDPRPVQIVDLQLPSPSQVRVLITDNLGTLVLAADLNITAGDFAQLEPSREGGRTLALVWNLRAANGVPVPEGVYLWKIVAQSAGGQSLETVKKLGVHGPR